MFRRMWALQVAMILNLVPTFGLAEGVGTASSARTPSFWDIVANSLADHGDPLVTEPMKKILPIVSIVVGGLMYAFEDNPSKRVLPAIVFAVGLMIAAVNYLQWLGG